MLRKYKVIAAAAVIALGLTGLAGCSSSSDSAAGGGTIAIITVDPANPYWKAEVDTAVATATELGYETTVNAHGNDPAKQTQFIDAAISAGVKAIILDPAGADESVGAVQKATDAGIPVFLVNAEISAQGVAKAQIVSNNAQGATLGAQTWVEAMGGKGKYVELFGNPTDNNAKVRSDAYHAVIDQIPGFKLLQKETANWDRAQGKAKMELMLQAHPDLQGVIAGNDDAVAAVIAGEMVATVLQPIVDGTKAAVNQAHAFLTDGTLPASEKQAIDCILITKENASKLKGFVLS